MEVPRLSLLLALTTALHVAPGAVLIVNQASPNASDRNPASVEKPLKTISAAALKAQAGDKVLIHSGEYRETVILKSSGTKDAPITIEAAPDETVVIKGSDEIGGWTIDQGAIWKASVPKPADRSTDTADASFWIANDIHRVFIRDGVLLDAIHLRRITAKEKMERGSFYYDTKNRFLYVWLPASDDPNKYKIEAAVRGAWLNILGSNVIVRQIQMRHASTLAISNWPACNIQGDHNRLEDCAITWGDFAGVSVSGNSHTLLRCTIGCNGCAGIGGTGNGHSIERCRVLCNNLDRYDPGWHGGGAKIIPNFSNGRIIGNEFGYNIGPGLWLDGNCNENELASNYCHDNEGPGIMVEVSAGNRIVNNISTTNRNPLAGEFLSPNPEAGKNAGPAFQTQMLNDKTRSSLIDRSGGGLGIFVSSSPQTRVFNNTCYLNEGGGITVEGPVRDKMSTRDCQILNNITVYNKGPQLILRKEGLDPNTTGNTSDHNLLLAIGAIFARNGWDGETTFTLEEWQRITKRDMHSREADPRFAMAAMNDFRVLNGSPAIHAGQILPEVKRDFFGEPRSDQSATIGACEKSSLDYPRPPLW